MQIQSDEEAYATVMDIMKNEGNMRTFVKLNCSLLNPSTELARLHVQQAFDYVVKEYKATQNHFVYLTLKYINIQATF